MNYPSALRYLDSFINYEKIVDYPYSACLNLARMEYLTGLFDNPHKKFRSIHIAGTKGKGSTAAMLASILKEAGLKTGLYTSPHLISPRERIRILAGQYPDSDFRPPVEASPHLRFAQQNSGGPLGLEGMISEDEICRLIEEIIPAIEKIQRDGRFGDISFFEIYTLLAFLYFAQEHLDIAVVETGMGGRLDATNIVNPLVAVFTPISLDHTDKLGPTISDIAREKTGIIKKGCSVLSSPQPEEALNRIKDVSKEKGALFSVLNGNICEEPRGLKISLKGRYQLDNAALAVKTAELLGRYNIAVSEDSIRKGLSRVVWPGRMHLIGSSPLVIVDGAQNRSSARALKESIKDFSFDRLILVLGVSSNKDIAGIARELCPGAGRVILTKADNCRAARPEQLKEKIADYITAPAITNSSKEALDLAKGEASKDDLILITGSLYLVGEILKRQSQRTRESESQKVRMMD